MSKARASMKTSKENSTAAATSSTGKSKSIAAKKTPGKKVATKKAPAKKSAGNEVAAKKASATKPSATNAGAKNAAAKKASAKKAPATKTMSKKQAAPKKSAGTESSASAPSTEKSTTSSASRAKAKALAANQSQPLPSYLTDKKWLDGQRKLLLEERGKYTLSAETLMAEAQALMADRDPGDVQFDEESGEGDTLAVERDRDLALSGLAREKVDEIDAALRRLAAGTYGICLSGEADPIPQERLEYVPMAAKCVKHQTAMF
jgi:RNA polymerase-binding transcription factor DksA